MSTLTFPTMAEKIEAAFRNATKAVSVATLAKKAGAEVVKGWQNTTYWFDDDTRLVVTGSGRNHKITTELP